MTDNNNYSTPAIPRWPTSPLAALPQLTAAAQGYSIDIPDSITGPAAQAKAALAYARTVPQDDRDLLAEVARASSVEAGLAAVADRLNTRRTFRELNKGSMIAKAAREFASASLVDTWPSLFAAMAPGMATDADTLREHAAAIPETLDPKTILRDPAASEAWRVVVPVLDRLLAAVDSMPYLLTQPYAVPQIVSRLLYVVEPVAVEPQLLCRDTFGRDWSSEQDQAIRKAWARWEKGQQSPEDRHVALIAVARGAVPGLTLAVTDDANEAAERAGRFAVHNMRAGLTAHEANRRDVADRKAAGLLTVATINAPNGRAGLEAERAASKK